MEKKQIFKVRERFPCISDLQKRATKKVPHFSMEYLECGTGREETVEANLRAFADIKLEPRFLAGHVCPDVKTRVFEQDFELPIGIAPVGMASLVWPGAELRLAELARLSGIPFCMSSLAAETMESIASECGSFGWFQLYPTRDRNIRDVMIDQASALGFKALVLTVDVPIPSVRERQKRAGLSVPPRKGLAFWLSIVSKPVWAISTLLRGEPRFLTLEKYVPKDKMRNQSQFFAEELGGTLDWNYVAEIRARWKGPIVMKGVLSPADAKQAVLSGVDAVWVSNHGGRQFDAAPSSLEQLPIIRSAVGNELPVFVDGGVRSGLDVMRAIHQGADFVFLGRPFIYGVAADVKHGAQEALNILKRDLENAMIQCGCRSVKDVRDLIQRGVSGGKGRQWAS
ncbi:alpha-hydroxy acid oxidase [Hoeflea prorocentri]|uniref:Alpha-hydroxy acid oxidase n=1 Tax=Hoeflea prorocentri TaxID=1922333 RepID=A0A9X3ZK37_9HYPH|nr:alpha-hydroxy acid oxidase [Hoeflea prorocentri]MCY6383743.1 alpha-hydroxy acid oxidase [Hoeflea prorocentri]MDA5401543.1 alpha-hydroxy acid oxidase [Hoeflea prorocentri]